MLFTFFTFLACQPSREIIQLVDDNNFEFSSEITAESTVVLGGEDALIDWSSLSLDLLGRPLDEGADLDLLSILHFPRLSKGEVLFGISNESLKQSDLNGYVELSPEAGMTQAWLSEFSIQGTFVEPSEHILADSGTYLIRALSSAEETLMLSFFFPEAEGESAVLMHNDSASLDYTVDLQGADEIIVPDASEYVLSWSELSSSGTGIPIQQGQLDSLTLASFDADVDTLEANFLSLSSLSLRWFEADVYGKTALDLSTLSDSEGQPFSGFDEDRNWMISLGCGPCVNPAPLFVGVLIR